MVEELIVSGRHNPEIDPMLHIWGWEIPLYLFLNELITRILFFSGFLYVRGRSDTYPTAVKWAPLFTPILLGIGLLALLMDLSHKLYFWQLYTNIRFESPMSWGAWTLLIVTPLSAVWAASWVKDLYPNFKWPHVLIDEFFRWFESYKKLTAWALMVLSVILGMYTGILLSAFNARPFWNTAILGPLFLVSGLSAGAAFTLFFSKTRQEKKLFVQFDLILIGIELFLIVHLFMGFLAGTQVHIEAAQLFLGGPYTTVFWVFVVFLGLILPAIFEILEFNKYKIPHFIPPLLVIIGGLLLRFIVVDAGQASRWLY